MNSLTLGFFYVVGLSWALSETCVIASNGNWFPLIVFGLLFVLMFSVLGCLRISAKAVEVWGGIFAVALSFLLLYMAVSTAMAGATVLAVVKGVFAVAFVIVGFLSLLFSLKPAKH